MKILLIDTSHRKSFVALADGMRIVAHSLLEGATRQSECAASALKVLLEQAQWSARDLGLVAVGVGPGSYTGIRVALSLAKGLNLATGVPLTPFCSLSAYAGEGVTVLFDARAGGVYLLDADGPRALSDEAARPLLEGRTICSPDISLLKPRFALERAVWREREPNLDQLLIGVLEQEQKEDGMVVPLYLKRPVREQQS